MWFKYTYSKIKNRNQKLRQGNFGKLSGSLQSGATHCEKQQKNSTEI